MYENGLPRNLGELIGSDREREGLMRSLSALIVPYSLFYLLEKFMPILRTHSLKLIEETVNVTIRDSKRQTVPLSVPAMFDNPQSERRIFGTRAGALGLLETLYDYDRRVDAYVSALRYMTQNEIIVPDTLSSFEAQLGDFGLGADTIGRVTVTMEPQNGRLVFNRLQNMPAQWLPMERYTSAPATGKCMLPNDVDRDASKRTWSQPGRAWHRAPFRCRIAP